MLAMIGGPIGRRFIARLGELEMGSVTASLWYLSMAPSCPIGNSMGWFHSCCVPAFKPRATGEFWIYGNKLFDQAIRQIKAAAESKGWAGRLQEGSGRSPLDLVQDHSRVFASALDDLTQRLFDRAR